MNNQAKLDVAKEALQWAYECFLARDLMNAHIHCSPLRLSPVTERVKQALEAINTTPSTPESLKENK